MAPPPCKQKKCRLNIYLRCVTVKPCWALHHRNTFSKIKRHVIFHVFPWMKMLKRVMTSFQLRGVVAFWASVWSASLFPVQTESRRRKQCLQSWEPQPGPCEVSRPARHMFSISASVGIERSRYRLKEPNPHRPKQTHPHISIWFTQCQAQQREHIQTNWFPQSLKKNAKQNSCFKKCLNGSG